MSEVLVSLDAGVLAVTLNRPDKLNSFNPPLRLGLRAASERDLQLEAGQTGDFREGVTAFREKRKPAFRGHESRQALTEEGRGDEDLSDRGDRDGSACRIACVAA